MSNNTSRVAWYPLDGKGWPDRKWYGSDTWIDGHRIFARISPDGELGQPPLLMLHGAVVSGSYFGPIARHLDNTCRTFVPDLAGFGRSTASTMLSLDEHVAVLDRWMEVHGLRQAMVVANSTGCQVATMLATKYPERVSCMVLVAPTMDPVTRGLSGLMLRGLIDIPRERQRLWTIWIPDLLSSGPIRGIHHLLDALRDCQMQRLDRVRQPTVCVAGERDPICPPAWVESMARGLPAGRSVILPGAPHAMNFSAPAALAEVIRSMLDDNGQAF